MPSNESVEQLISNFVDQMEEAITFQNAEKLFQQLRLTRGLSTVESALEVFQGYVKRIRNSNRDRKCCNSCIQTMDEPSTVLPNGSSPTCRGDNLIQSVVADEKSRMRAGENGEEKSETRVESLNSFDFSGQKAEEVLLGSIFGATFGDIPENKHEKRDDKAPVKQHSKTSTSIAKRDDKAPVKQHSKTSTSTAKRDDKAPVKQHSKTYTSIAKRDDKMPAKQHSKPSTSTAKRDDKAPAKQHSKPSTSTANFLNSAKVKEIHQELSALGTSLERHKKETSKAEKLDHKTKAIKHKIDSLRLQYQRKLKSLERDYCEAKKSVQSHLEKYTSQRKEYMSVAKKLASIVEGEDADKYKKEFAAQEKIHKDTLKKYEAACSINDNLHLVEKEKLIQELQELEDANFSALEKQERLGAIIRKYRLLQKQEVKECFDSDDDYNSSSDISSFSDDEPVATDPKQTSPQTGSSDTKEKQNAGVVDKTPSAANTSKNPKVKDSTTQKETIPDKLPKCETKASSKSAQSEKSLDTCDISVSCDSDFSEDSDEEEWTIENCIE